MGKCQFCGKDAGFLQSTHKECKQAYEEGATRILEIASKAAVSQVDFPTLHETLRTVASTSFVNDQILTNLLASAWEMAVFQALDDSVLSQAEEQALIAFKDYFSLSDEILDRSGAYTKAARAAALRDILEGKIPQRVQIEGTLPFNFQKGETLVWLFRDVLLYEPRTRTVYTRGGYSGISIRVAKGVYYRIGEFESKPVTRTQNEFVDAGFLGVTTKHIYFSGKTKGFRIRYDKIVSFNPHSDGITIQRDASSAKPQIFVTGDGWFTYNLITNLARLMAA
jgi:hypothetical protein